MVGDKEADALHLETNKPELPKIDGRTIKFPPYEYHAFPCAMYHASDATSPRVAKDENEQRNLISRGWSPTPGGAEAIGQMAEEDRATIAALRAGDDRKMSRQAQAEAAHVEETTEDFVPEVPEAKRRGRHTKEGE